MYSVDVFFSGARAHGRHAAGRTDGAPQDTAGLDTAVQDTGALPDADLVERAVTATTRANAASGEVAEMVAEFVRRRRVEAERARRADEQDGSGNAGRRRRVRELVRPERLAAAEFGAALALGSGAADDLVGVSVTLVTRLSATFRLLRAGLLSWSKAKVVADAVAGLTDEQAAAVEAAVLGKAADRTPAQHRAAVSRAVDRVDPDGSDERRRSKRREIRLARAHLGDGMGELFASLPSELLDELYLGADGWARRRKAAGDERPLDELRVMALVEAARHYFGGRGDAGDVGPDAGDPDAGDPDPADPDAGGPADPDAAGPDAPDPDADSHTADTAASDTAAAGTDDERGAHHDSRDGGATCSDGPAPATSATGAARSGRAARRSSMRRQGTSLRLGLLWDLRSLVGTANAPGELLDSGASLPPSVMRELIAAGVHLRRMLVDPGTGELLDLTPQSSALGRPGSDGAARTLFVVVDRETLTAYRTGRLADSDPELARALSDADGPIREMLDAPETADGLDVRPDCYRPSARLAEFAALRFRHPANPSAGTTAAAAGDIDHVVSFDAGGPTVRANLAPYLRRWHLLKTHTAWTTHVSTDGSLLWTSPTGRRYRVDPFDYRLGP